VTGGIAIAAWVLLVLALAGRWGAVVAWALAGFGAEYALYLRLHGGSVDPRVLFVAGALVLVAELAFRAIASPQGTAEGNVAARSALALVASVLSASIVAGVVLVAAGSVSSGVGLEALGVLSAAIVVAAVVRIAARTRDSTST